MSVYSIAAHIQNAALQQFSNSKPSGFDPDTDIKRRPHYIMAAFFLLMNCAALFIQAHQVGDHIRDLLLGQNALRAERGHG